MGFEKEVMQQYIIANDIATYRILRGFVYVMNLKRANIPADRIKDIIGRMF